MDKILLFILRNFSILYEEYKMEIIEGYHSKANGGSGKVTLHNESISLSFIRDRGVMNITIKNKKNNSLDYSLFYVMELITGNKKLWRYNLSKFPAGIPNFEKKKYYGMVISNFSKIYELFSDDNIEKTTTELNTIIRGINKNS